MTRLVPTVLAGWALLFAVPTGVNRAVVVSHTFPARVTAGAAFTVTVTMKNTGTTTWTQARLYRLGAVGDQDPFRPGTTPRVWLPADVSVAPGATYTFRLGLRAPATPGDHVSDWRMVQERVAWFGQTASRVITVAPPTRNAAVVSHSFPAEVVAGSSFTATVTMKNTGGTTWTQALAYRLGAVGDRDPFRPGTTPRVWLPAGASVRPGATHTFTLSLRAPSAPGSYVTDWRMLQEGVAWFGQTVARTIAVRPAVPVVWTQAGAFAFNVQNFPAAAYGATLRSNGIKWIALQIHDGTARNPQAESVGPAAWIREWRAAGLSVGGWGVNRLDPEGDAALAAALIDEWGLDFYIADAEMEYKYTQADNSWSGEAYGRSRRFVTAFRARKPAFPAAVSSYGRTDLADIDWAAWREGGFDWLPQAYWNDYAHYQPSLCVSAAVASGWPRERVHPTIGIWGGGVTRVVPASEYVPDLRAAGTVGFSVYLAEQAPVDEWTVLGAGVASGLAR